MLTQGPYFLDMSKEKDESEIAREDCPPNCAAAYPGKFGRNNRGGSVLTKEEFTEVAVRCWIDHFADSEKYQNTSLAHKTRYLVRHLKVFIMTIMSLPRSAAAHLAAGSGYFLTGRVAFDHQIVIIIIKASQGEFSKISNVANFFPIFERG